MSKLQKVEIKNLNELVSLVFFLRMKRLFLEWEVHKNITPLFKHVLFSSPAKSHNFGYMPDRTATFGA